MEQSHSARLKFKKFDELQNETAKVLDFNEIECINWIDND